MLKPAQTRNVLSGLLLAFTIVSLSASRSGHAAGVTIITHGLNSNVDDWVISMAEQMTRYSRFPGTHFTCYELYFTPSGASYALAWKRLGGDAPLATDSGEILIKLDWRQLANNSYSTYDVASIVVPQLLQPNFISELNGHALAEVPIHLVGHSRGGSLDCQMSLLLGTNGVWVDHLTTLDPHPLNNDGFFDFPYTVVDAPARTYENVLFHDNYYQTINSLFHGEPVTGAYVRQLTNLGGGYGGLAAAHSNVHLWYHGTVDWLVPADDTVASITSAERQSWWTPSESNGVVAGFYYSLIGGGDRLGTARIRDGYNQKYFSVGLSNNRTALPSNNGDWPNLITFNFTGSNLVAYGFQSNAVTLTYQWARPAASNATVRIYLDDDFNPYNGNERLVREFNVAGTTSGQVGAQTVPVDVNATNSSPGVHAVYAKISGGGRSRYLYAPQLLTVFSSFQRPVLGIARSSGDSLRVDVAGVSGQRVVLEATPDFRNWQPLATNWLTTNLWSYLENQTQTGRRFYRATLR